MSKLKKSFGSIVPAMRISFALVMLSSCVLLSAEIFGFTPKENQFLVESRTKISESLALQMSVLIPDKEIKKIKTLIRYIVKRNPDILSAGIRRASGQLVYQSANHEELWGDYQEKASTTTHVLVPILQKGRLWANVELRFQELKGETFHGFFDQAIFKLILFFMVIGFFVYLAFMLKTLRQLDPSSVIPERVNAAFDTLAEGVMIVDEQEQILLANKAFCEKIDISESSLLGMKASDLSWKIISANKSGTEFPWKKVITSKKSSIGAQLMFKLSKSKEIKFAMNASPILDSKENLQGVLITVDDISKLEQRNQDLKTVVSRLQKTQFQVEQQNKELTYLATRDPLTGCLNRRSFSEQFKDIFDKAREQGTELSCLMVDIDHFKKVNDTFGHATGDEVIKMLAEILKSNTHVDDLVGRYGGEEFCLVCPGMPDAAAMKMAERIRLKIKSESTARFENGPRVTASLGVASMHDNPDNPGDLNNLADQGLYIAKESGRNQVIRWKSDPDRPVVIPEKPAQEASETEDITQLRTRISELEELASSVSAELEYNQSYDVLTGLPKQLLFYDRVHQAIERGFRLDQLAAVLVIDIEMFSQINTSLGRSVGDQLLQKFSERLNTIFRKADGVTRLTVSRFAGDEFAVLLTDIKNQEQVTWAVKRLLDNTGEPIEIEGHTVHTTAKVGISLYPTDANSVDELFNHAMAAKKYCKQNKTRFNYHFFDEQMQELSLKHIHLEKELHEAIDKEQWELLLQPKLDLTLGKIVGVEALIRWIHPERGMVTPYEFMGFAEQRKMIIPIGDWVIRQACQLLNQFKERGINDCKIAINLSPVQLVQGDIVEKILSTLDEYHIAPRLFEVEVTETAIIENINVAMESLKRLSARGIQIAIDDFGTGYSSLNYLKNLPIDILKIDRSFVKDMCVDHNDEKIVQTLITMAHSLELKVVAEGVEDQQQLELLRGYGCDEIQGYLISKPTNMDSVIQIVNNPLENLKPAEGLPQAEAV